MNRKVINRIILKLWAQAMGYKVKWRKEELDILYSYQSENVIRDTTID